MSRLITLGIIVGAVIGTFFEKGQTVKWAIIGGVVGFILSLFGGKLDKK